MERVFESLYQTAFSKVWQLVNAPELLNFVCTLEYKLLS